MSRGPGLTVKELEFIKVHLLDMSIRQIADALGRNYYTVFNYSKRMGSSKNHEFTPQEDNYIIRNYDRYKVEDIAAKLRIPVSSVYNRARNLGVSKFKHAVKD